MENNTPNHFSSSPRALALELYTMGAHEAYTAARIAAFEPSAETKQVAAEWSMIADALRPTELDK